MPFNYMSLSLPLLSKNNYLSKFDKFLLTIIFSRAILNLQVHKNKSTEKGPVIMKDRLTLFTKYLLDLMFYAGIVVTATLPLSF